VFALQFWWLVLSHAQKSIVLFTIATALQGRLTSWPELDSAAGFAGPDLWFVKTITNAFINHKATLFAEIDSNNTVIRS
jgi:hypothetical protein